MNHIDVNKLIRRKAIEHAHKCFPYNASGDSARHAVHIKNQADSFSAGARAFIKIGMLTERLRWLKQQAACGFGVIESVQATEADLARLTETKGKD